MLHLATKSKHAAKALKHLATNLFRLIGCLIIYSKSIYKWHVCPGSNNSSRGDKWEMMEVGIEIGGGEGGKVKWERYKEEKEGR